MADGAEVLTNDFVAKILLIRRRGCHNLRNTLPHFQIVVEDNFARRFGFDKFDCVADVLCDFVVVTMCAGVVGNRAPERNILADMTANINHATDIGIVVLKSAILFEQSLRQRLFK